MYETGREAFKHTADAVVETGNTAQFVLSRGNVDPMVLQYTLQQLHASRDTGNGILI
jgi:hypothetical protein